MALIKCSECGHEISTLATVCPGCGAPVPLAKPLQPASNSFIGSLRMIAAFVIVAAIFLYIASLFNNSNKAATTYPTSSGLAQANASFPNTEFSTTAFQVQIDYANNPVAADNHYKDHRFSISGLVSDLNTDSNDIATITLMDDLEAKLLNSENGKAATLSSLENVTLECTGDGNYLKIPMLKDCVIQSIKTMNTSAPSASSVTADTDAPPAETSAPLDTTTNTPPTLPINTVGQGDQK